MSLESAIASFAEGMKKTSEKIACIDPDYVIAPMMGTVPFIDAMYVADPNFDPNIVFYMPASSHIPNVNTVMRDWMGNFLHEHATAQRSVSLVTIDEVVSGSSATRVNRALRRAAQPRTSELIGNTSKLFWTQDPERFSQAAAYLDRLTSFAHHDFVGQMVRRSQRGVYETDNDMLQTDAARRHRIIEDYFADHIKVQGIGIEDAKNGRYENRPRNPQYEELKEQGHIIPIPVEVILTMDNAKMCPVTYEYLEGREREYVRFKPIVQEEPTVTPLYMELLRRIKEHTDSPREPVPVSIERARFSSDYLSEDLGGDYQKAF